MCACKGLLGTYINLHIIATTTINGKDTIPSYVTTVGSLHSKVPTVAKGKGEHHKNVNFEH